MKFSETSVEFQEACLRSESRVYGKKFVNLVHQSFGSDIDNTMDFLIALGQFFIKFLEFVLLVQRRST